MDDALQPGETVIAEWRPTLRAFLTKIGVVAIAATLIFGPPILWLAGPKALLLLPLFLVLYIVGFDDLPDWNSRRHDRWRLTNRRLILTNPDDPALPAILPLSEIEGIRVWMWWALFLDLANGQSATMSFVQRPRRVRERILAARDAQNG